MSCDTRADWAQALGALRASVSRLLELGTEMLTSPKLKTSLGELEVECRRIPAAGYQLINQLAAQASPAELDGTLGQALVDRLRITKADADGRIADAADLGPRRALTGEPLAPLLPATAAAQREGLVGAGHVRLIRTFFKKLPETVDAPTRHKAEADLGVKAAAGYRPDELACYAKLLHNYLHLDGNFADQQRARTRGISIGAQQPNGMSTISGHLTPQCRAIVEPVLAKLGAPGMCNPDDEEPVTDGKAPRDAVDRDTRSRTQRNHDAIAAGLRKLLESKALGQHHGSPTSIVVTTTLAELQAGAGQALTAGGTLLPMSDVIWLASPEQRLAMLAKHGGCTRPGCTVPGSWPADPTTEWSNSANTSPAETPTATPNGYPRHTSITDGHEPTACIIQRSSLKPGMTTAKMIESRRVH